MAVNPIYLVTERPLEARALALAIGEEAECVVVGPDVDWGRHPGVQAVVTDSDLRLLPGRTFMGRLKVAHSEAPPPVIVIVGEFTAQNVANAERLGATFCLSASLPQEAVVKGVMAQAFPGTGKAQRRHRRGIGRAGEAVHAILRPLLPGETFDMAPVEAGLLPILAAIESGGLGPWLDTVRAHDDATYQHCMLVAGLAAAFAVGNRFPRDQQARLVRAALVHDVGKSAIPLAILNKPGKLDHAETEVMRLHPGLGADILRRGGCTDAMTLDATLHHHEMIDGSGYPDGISGEAISDVVRLITVCDIYAALIERRAYREPMAAEEAIGILCGMGGRVEQGFVAAFAASVLKVSPASLAA